MLSKRPDGSVKSPRGSCYGKNVTYTVLGCSVFQKDKYVFLRDELETLKSQLKQKEGELELKVRSSVDAEQEVK